MHGIENKINRCVNSTINLAQCWITDITAHIVLLKHLLVEYIAACIESNSKTPITDAGHLSPKVVYSVHSRSPTTYNPLYTAIDMFHYTHSSSNNTAWAIIT